MKRRIILLLGVFMFGCAERPALIPTATPTMLDKSIITIDKQKALDLANKLALGGDGRLSPAEKPLGSQTAELLSLADARRKVNTSTGYVDTLPDTTLVWFVEIDGSWTLVGGPVITSETTPVVKLHSFTKQMVLLDAQTGQMLFSLPK